MNRTRIWLIAAGILGATAVAMGAYQAHGMESYLAEQGLEPSELWHRLDLSETAVRYQMFHALGLLCIAILAEVRHSRLWNYVAVGFLLGTILFSGALYGLAMMGLKALAHVAPVGGLTLIISWLGLALAGLRGTPLAPSMPSSSERPPVL